MITKFKVIGLMLLTISSSKLVATELQKNAVLKFPIIEQIKKELHKNIDPIAHSNKYKNKECGIRMKLNKKGYIYETKALWGDIELCNLLDEAITKAKLRHEKIKVKGETTISFNFWPEDI